MLLFYPSRVDLSVKVPIMRKPDMSGFPNRIRRAGSPRYSCCVASPPPICVPITSLDTIISTRRFICRPCGVSLLAVGIVLPNPSDVIVPGNPTNHG